MKIYKKEYHQKGFFIVPNFFEKKYVNKINKAISEIHKSKNVKIYNDRSGNLRRMEHFVFKNTLFQEINKKFINFLTKVTLKKQILFKDKVNFKPPLGEGFHPHYDGVFQFKTQDGKVKNGWYEYTDEFNNILLALDDFNHENGPLEVANADHGSFEKLIKNTKLDGTPEIKNELIKKISFVPMYIMRGSLVVFKHTCPHRSSPNNSSSERRSLYFTYNNSVNGDFYEQYFFDKDKSINSHKSLIGDKI